VDSIISIRNLTKRYGVVPALRGLNLDVARREFLALCGPNGSGKTTLIRILAALARPTGGTVQIGGWTLPAEAAYVRAHLGVVSHLPLVYDTLTAEENLLLFARLYNLPRDQRRERVEAVLRRVGLWRRAGDVVRTYSRGMVQRLAIARAILHDPAVLLLDEPYTGLDQDAAALLDNLLGEVGAGGRTIMMTTHNLPRAHRLADRIAVLSQGRIVFDTPCSQVESGDLPALYADVTGSARAR
jgi:ABC-type multidrug transport system ATPase subunit